VGDRDRCLFVVTMERTLDDAKASAILSDIADAIAESFELTNYKVEVIGLGQRPPQEDRLAHRGRLRLQGLSRTHENFFATSKRGGRRLDTRQIAALERQTP